MASFLDLPAEIITEVLSHLPVGDLNNVAETCQGLKHIINDQELWKNLFQKQFHTDKFSSLTRTRKFSEELFVRGDLLRHWKKEIKITKLVTLASPIKDVRMAYPRCFAMEEAGILDVVTFDKPRLEAQIPVAVRGCSSLSFSTFDAVAGSVDGTIVHHPLQPRHYYTDAKKFDKKHTAAVTAVDCDELNTYTGDMNGVVFISENKSSTVLQEFNIKEPVLKLRGYKECVVALTAASIQILRADQKSTTIPYTEGIEFFNVDFGGEVVIVGNDHQIWSFSFSSASFGRSSTYEVPGGIVEIAFEHKVSPYDSRVAGQDGCNMALITKDGQLVTFNIRRSIHKPQSLTVPKFDKKALLVSWERPLRSVAVSSAVVLVGTYNGCAAVFDVLTGSMLSCVSKRLTSRYFPSVARFPHQTVPVTKVILSDNNVTSGVIVVDNVVIYFQVGEVVKAHKGKKRKNVQGVTGDRKNVIHRTIKTEIDELEYREQIELEQAELLTRYNGNGDLTMEEEIELAMVLNASLQVTNEEYPGQSAAMDLSMIESSDDGRADIGDSDVHSLNLGTELVENANNMNDDDEFERQLQEALRRSLLE